MTALRTLIMLSLLALVSLFIALSYGSLSLSVREVFDALFSAQGGLNHDVIWQLRMPRALAAFACGALLAVSGVLLQVLLRNPLADPYILGVSGGASLGALAAMLFGAGWLWTHAGALAGALAAIVLVFSFSFRSGDWSPQRLLLTGVVLSAGFTALISLVLVLAPQTQLKGMLFWLMGDLSNAGESGTAWLLLAVVVTLSCVAARSLNALALGALKARSLGVAVTAVQSAIYVGAAAATVAAVLLGGSIGFVGLMAPHALRLLGVYDHRWLVPGAALVGGSFIVIADTLARSAWAPQQLPAGIFAAMFGVPAMLLLLARKS